MCKCEYEKVPLVAYDLALGRAPVAYYFCRLFSNNFILACVRHAALALFCSLFYCKCYFNRRYINSHETGTRASS
jgi:hypothetical protein